MFCLPEKVYQSGQLRKKLKVWSRIYIESLFWEPGGPLLDPFLSNPLLLIDIYKEGGNQLDYVSASLTKGDFQSTFSFHFLGFSLLYIIVFVKFGGESFVMFIDPSFPLRIHKSILN